MLNFASHELNDWRETSQTFEYISAPKTTKTTTAKILAEKILIPAATAEIVRPRLSARLEKSLQNFSATLITGRAGTGKTAFAADFARQNRYDVAWYKTDSTDSKWKVFLGYLSECLRAFKSETAPEAKDSKQSANAETLTVTESLAEQFATLDTAKPLLLIIDDLHSVFDADWFDEFFNALISLPSANVKLLLLARSLPSFPLWRLRSKQVLDVLDEKMLGFTMQETIELFESRRLSVGSARLAQSNAYGRIAKLREIAEKLQTGQN